MEKLVLQAGAHLSHRAHKGSFHVVRRGIKKNVWGPPPKAWTGNLKLLSGVGFCTSCLEKQKRERKGERIPHRKLLVEARPAY